MSRTRLGRNAIGQISDDRMQDIGEYIETMLADYFNRFDDVDLIDLTFLVHNKIGWARCLAMMNEVPKKEEAKND